MMSGCRRVSLELAEEVGAMPELYDTDFFAWLQQQAAAIRVGDWDAIDREDLAEEIDSIVRHASSELRHHLDELLVWFLVWAYAPESREAHPHWYVRIVSQRCEIETIVGVWPHLAQTIATALPKAYAHGREVASEETGLPLARFPEICPWAPEQVIRHSFWAGERA